jgi:hypothetical protein
MPHPKHEMKYLFGNKDKLEEVKKELENKGYQVDGPCLHPDEWRLCLRWQEVKKNDGH